MVSRFTTVLPSASAANGAVFDVSDLYTIETEYREQWQLQSARFNRPWQCFTDKYGYTSFGFLLELGRDNRVAIVPDLNTETCQFAAPTAVGAVAMMELVNIYHL